MNIMTFQVIIPIQKIEAKSRRDGILLTVDFNLRTKSVSHSLQSPAGTAQWRDQVSSLRDSLSAWLAYSRRLKPTVNKVLSLRDISPLTRSYPEFLNL
jgi:hypothetical protein